MLKVVIFYLIFTTILALFTTRRAKALEDFLVAGRRLGYFFLIPLFMAELIGGASTVGMSELAYKIGISSAWFNISMAIGCILVASLAAGWYKESGITTVPEAFLRIFDEKCRLMVCAIFCVVYFVLFTVEISALSAILSPLFKISPQKAQILSAFVFLLLTAAAGLWTVAWCNVLHALVIYVGMFIALYYAIGASGGWLSVIHKLPKSYFNPLSLGTPKIFAWLLGLPLAFVVSQPMIQSVVSAWDPKKAKRSVICAGIFIILLALSVAFIGMAARVSYLRIVPRQLLFMIAKSAPDPFGGIIIAGIIAALLSTAPILLLALATIIKQDFLSLFPWKFSDKSDVWIVRLIMLANAFFSLLLAPKIKLILGTLMDAFQIRAVVGIVFLAGLYWRKMDASKAFWSMGIAGTGGILWVILGKPFKIEPIYISLLLCGITLAFLTLIKSKEV